MYEVRIRLLNALLLAGYDEGFLAELATSQRFTARSRYEVHLAEELASLGFCVKISEQDYTVTESLVAYHATIPGCN